MPMPERIPRHHTGLKWKTVLQRMALLTGVVGAVALFGGCPVRRFFGVSCPGCGMMRACLSLIQLDFRAAFAYHPLVFVLVPAVLYILFREVLPFSLNRKTETVFLAAFLLALVLVYCYRMFISHAAVLEVDFSSSVLYQIISFLKKPGGAVFPCLAMLWQDKG